MAPYVLPSLDYDFGALQPHISGEIMELHHDKHHRAYVEKANEAAEKLDEARGKLDFSGIASLERALAFNLSAHALHSIFWKNLTPRGGGAPAGDFRRALQRAFGSFEAFKAQLTALAGALIESGWAALVWEPIGQRLLTCQIYDHQSNVSQGGTPLMVIDAWEHAYYLQYKSQKAEFFEAVWNLCNWDDISSRFAAVQGREMASAGRSRGIGKA